MRVARVLAVVVAITLLVIIVVIAGAVSNALQAPRSAELDFYPSFVGELVLRLASSPDCEQLRLNPLQPVDAETEVACWLGESVRVR